MRRSPKEVKGERLRVKGREDGLGSEVEGPKPEIRKNAEAGMPDAEAENNSALEIPPSGVAKSETATALLSAAENKQQRKIENSKSEIKEMEVHHHPEVEKKGIKEYILEGLMIFLAVMMGFIAESIRENITNGEHAKQLTSQLVRDLRNDTTNLQENILYETKLDKKEDSLFTLLQQPLQKIDRKRLQWLISKNYNVKLFFPSLGAITAIKNELHLKQFSKSEISTYITGYEGRANVLKELENLQKSNMNNYLASFFKDHFTPVNTYALFHDRPVLNGEMRNLAQEDITKLSIEIAMIQAFNGDMISYDKKMKKNAVSIIQYVTQQYGLEDE
jgi:hypothetical protein